MQNPAAFRWMFAQLKQLQKLQHFAGSATAGGKPKLDFGYQLQEARRINTCKRQAQQNLIGCLCSGLRKKTCFFVLFVFFPSTKKTRFFPQQKTCFFLQTQPCLCYHQMSTTIAFAHRSWRTIKYGTEFHGIYTEKSNTKKDLCTRQTVVL